MKLSLKPLNQQVLVITGASSGIGLATAHLAARRGARGLVLVARSSNALRQLENEINSNGRGTRAVAVACDVADEPALRRAADIARDRFGGFDTWINNAGVSIYGRIMDVSEEDFRRLFETNFWGVVHGSRIAVNAMRDRGGCLINIGSTLSDRSIPIQGMYAATKHAVKAFTDALRMELEEQRVPIAVTLIKPGAINTPYPEHARNYMTDEPTNPPPVYAPSVAAETILYAAEHPVRDLFVGSGGKTFQMAEKMMPRMTDKYMERVTIKQMHSGRPNDQRDALYEPSNDLREDGNYEGMVRQRSYYTAASKHGGLTLGTALGIGALALTASWLMKQPNSGRIDTIQPHPQPEATLRTQAESDIYSL